MESVALGHFQDKETVFEDADSALYKSGSSVIVYWGVADSDIIYFAKVFEVLGCKRRTLVGGECVHG